MFKRTKWGSGKNDFIIYFAIMETLDYLISKGLLLDGGFPIKPSEPIKVIKQGVIFQHQCHNGLPYDIAVSWLQKAIRRGLTSQALYCAYHMAQLGRIFRSHLLNRLIVIVSEDIGPAEPGLPIVAKKLYTTAKQAEKDEDMDTMHQCIIKLVTILSHSRKSRICDWMIHNFKDRNPEQEPYHEMFDSMKALVDWSVYLCIKRFKEDGWIEVCFQDEDGHEVHMQKKLQVWYVWNAILDVTQDTPIYRDVVALLRIFNIRGPEYGVLHIVHAAVLVYMYNTKDLPRINPEQQPSWNALNELSFPIMNDAVDLHTRYGRQHLGRTKADFIYHGSKLENWTPFPGEKELIKEFIDELVPPMVEDCHPRQYQQTIVDKAVSHLQTQRAGWLLMACGTGKTKTGYWITKQLVKEGIVVVVTPYLQILRQFHGCWSAMNRMHKVKSITGILASCDDRYDRDEYSNYEYLDSFTSIKKFLEYPDKLKFIYTTYSSLPRLLQSKLVEPALTVYDEAHHIKSHKMFKGDGMNLFLTATPHSDYGTFGEVIANYNLRDAIDDGFLTPYRVNVMQIESELQALAYAQTNSKKTIVYCKTNALARDFYEQWVASGGDITQAFYVNCKTSKGDRERIFRDFKALKRAVIFNCAILCEGVDFTDCDSIFIHSGYMSQTRVVQAMGRPLRLMKGKDQAQIYIMEDDPKKVDKRIAAMEYYDPKVHEYIDYIYEDDD